MATKISLINSALVLIGARPISSLEEGSAEATAAVTLYETSYQAILCDHYWRFATKTKSMPQLPYKPPEKQRYDKVYQVPNDKLLIIRVHPNSNYHIYGDKIYSNYSSLDLEYIHRVDEAMLPPYFVKLFELYLAFHFSVPITENQQKASLYLGAYKEQLKIAAARDSQEHPPDGFDDLPLVSDRWI